MRPTFFTSGTAFRAWLTKHHASRTELWVGFWKRATGKPCMSWSESVDEALCYGWIDGVRRSRDAESYVIRFTPRRPGSAWSALNLRKRKALEAAGRMTDAGRRAFHASDHRRSGYATKDFEKEFDAVALRAFRRERGAWTYFQAQPPGYRRITTYWVMSARRPKTRARRLGILIAASAESRRLDRMAPAKGKRG